MKPPLVVDPKDISFLSNWTYASATKDIKTLGFVRCNNKQSQKKYSGAYLVVATKREDENLYLISPHNDYDIGRTIYKRTIKQAIA